MIIIKKKSLLVMVLAGILTLSLFTRSAFAEGHSGDNKPGWGHGDKNHHHTGPPGHSVSVHPGDGDNDEDDGHHGNHGHHNGDDKRFQQLLSLWFQFLREHHWSWSGHTS